MLAEADMGLTSLAFGQVNPQDHRLMVRFEMYPHYDQDESTKAGRPIYKDREYIKILVPGDKTSEVHRLVWSQDLERFPQQYAKFKANQSQDSIDGTPLSVWPPISKAQVLELNYFNIRSVEQLANLADSNAQKFLGIQQLKRMAQDWLKNAKDTSHLTALRSELESRDNEIEVLRRNAATMAARLEKLEEQAEED